MVAASLLSLIFITLALIHFNWAVGKKFGLEASLPTKSNGEKILNPKKIDSAIVGIVLIFFGLFYVFITGLIQYKIPEWTIKWGGYIIPTLFFLRAIGEFKYIGFFKTVTNTSFAKLDTKLFSPLALLIGILGVLALLTK